MVDANRIKNYLYNKAQGAKPLAPKRVANAITQSSFYQTLENAVISLTQNNAYKPAKDLGKPNKHTDTTGLTGYTL